MKNRHLTSDEISQWVAGDRNVNMDKHLESCPVCQSEVAALTSMLADFRCAVHGWSDECRISDAHTTRKVRQGSSFYVQNLNWFCLAATALLIIAIMNFTAERTPENRQAKTVQTMASDADIMKQVETELARTVPTSMEPLTRLVSWDEGVTGSASRSGMQPN